ncbi:ACP S-malonyltransferase [Candidatus Hydrogenosomobacter endosymbioticus]|uniref:Malonyl CoA-acyl carrier protein transacylase n=1 Tax=Candidatus Hydrogenosomobacter endosymbioticus TaxID=2558174 RepID=A0ABN6L2X2_9PROT|nr:ACP S-malonyltransferase [Candidatus Hydrogenosomobacter endosymbioticus]BDB96253.1 malonyl CoA-acyl carrier protein transacylase [Candidatus Hydrogenosomobacter endosymbioticus]
MKKVKKFVCAFPGQGSQHVGMGASLIKQFSCARDIMEEISDACSIDIVDVMLSGAEEKLAQTEFSQLAIFSVSICSASVLQNEFGIDLSQACFMSGHSVGEYAAVCAAGVASIQQCAKIIRRRSLAMKKSCQNNPGKMLVVLGLGISSINEIVKEIESYGKEKCYISVDNIDGQAVLSGSVPALIEAAKIAKLKGAKRAAELNVEGPFHSPLMQEAHDEIKETIEESIFIDPVVPVITNFSARPQTSCSVIKNHLINQTTGKVRWRETQEFMASSGIEAFIELGASSILSGMAKKCIPYASCFSAQDAESMSSISDYMKSC